MCQLKHYEYEQRETRMDEFIVYGARVVRSNIARFRQEQRRLKAQGGLSTTAGIAAAAGVIDVDDDDAADDLDSDEVDGGFGAAAAVETCANCDIDGNDSDNGNSGAPTAVVVAERWRWKRRRCTGVSSPHRLLLARLALAPRRRQWACRLVRLSQVRWYLRARV